MNRTHQRTDAYAELLRLAHADARLLSIAVFRFSHGLPDDEEARKMIEETSEIVVAFNAALARVEIVGSQEAADAAKDVSRAAAQVGLRLRNSYLSGEPVGPDGDEAQQLKRAVEAFATLCRHELAESD